MKLVGWKRQARIGWSCTVTVCFFTVLLLPFTSCNHDINAYKDGDVVLGALLDLHYPGDGEHCGPLSKVILAQAEAIIFATESVNRNPNLLPNVTIGYDIRNYCESTALAMKITYDLVRGTDLLCTCSTKGNGSAIGDDTMVGSKPISALIGLPYSRSAVLVGSLLQVANINSSRESHCNKRRVEFPIV